MSCGNRGVFLLKYESQSSLSDLENCIIPLSYFSHFISWTHTKQRVFKSHPPFVRWSALSSVHVQNVTVKLPNKAAMTNSLNSVIFHSILWCNDLLRKKKWLENNFSSVFAPSYLIGAVELKLHLHSTKLGVFRWKINQTHQGHKLVETAV